MSETRYPPDRPFRSLTENLVRRGNETSTLVANVPNFLSREECARVVAAAERAGGHQGVVGVKDPAVAPIRQSEVRLFYPDASTAWLFDKLDQWGFDSLVIPHGTTWGIYTPPGSSWDKQLNAQQHDPERQ